MEKTFSYNWKTWFFSIWKAKIQKQAQIWYLEVHCPNVHQQSWLGQAEARNPKTWATTCCLLECTLTGSRLGHTPSTATENGGTPHESFTTVPHIWFSCIWIKNNNYLSLSGACIVMWVKPLPTTLTSRMGTILCPSSSTSEPALCRWPEKAVKDDPGYLWLWIHEGDPNSRLQPDPAQDVGAIREVNPLSISFSLSSN